MESVSSRNGPERCLKRISLLIAAGDAGCAATPGRVAVWWASTPAYCSLRAMRSAASLALLRCLTFSENGLSLCLAVIIEQLCQARIVLGQHLYGQQASVLGTVDADGGNRQAGRHHHR